MLITRFFSSPATWYRALIFLGLMCCHQTIAQKLIFKSKELKVTAISPAIWVHESYIIYKGDTVGCNGMVFIKGQQAMVFDCPTTSAAAQQLISLIRNSKSASNHRQVAGVVVNHFHNDCLGSLATFHKAGVKSYATNRTIALARADSTVNEVPMVGFDSVLVLKLADEPVVNRYFGPAHTQDNIISYLPQQKVMFGGCQVKCLGADKGYLGNADTKSWPNTIAKIKTAYPEVKLVIPGHGPWGGRALLDYTERLFRDSEE